MFLDLKMLICFDIGCKHFSITFFDLNLNYLINFKTISDFYEKLTHVLEHIFNKHLLNINDSAPDGQPHTIEIVIEKQHFSKNIQQEWYLMGSLKSLILLCFNKMGLIFKIHSLPSCLKKSIAKNKFNWKYAKIKSFKSLLSLQKENHHLFSTMFNDDWTLICFNCCDVLNEQNKIYITFQDICNLLKLKTCRFKKYKNFNKIKGFLKFEDYVDTRLLLFAFNDLKNTNKFCIV